MPIFGKLSIAQLQKYIRATAVDTAHVFITPHAHTRMRGRFVSDAEVYECLQRGRMPRRAEPDMKTGHLKCRMQHYCAGRNVETEVALDDNDPALIVVTVIV